MLALPCDAAGNEEVVLSGEPRSSRQRKFRVDSYNAHLPTNPISDANDKSHAASCVFHTGQGIRPCSLTQTLDKGRGGS